jgi:glycosyltransferase involved in cell wall biosynthesis
MQLEKRSKKKIYFIAPAPAGISPGQRFRFEHYLEHLKENNVDYDFSSFYTLSGWNTLFVPGKTIKKITLVLRGICVRTVDLFRVVKYDYVFIFREAAPVGPPVFEFLVSKLLKKKIVYDFDDAIWIPSSSEYNKFAYYFKWFGKIASICKWSYRVSVGNGYLADFALGYNDNVVVIPTVVDTELVHNKKQDQATDHPNIGWTGTFSTLKYLNIVLPVLQRLQEKINFTFIVIADKDPELPIKNYRFIRWQKDTEAEDLLNIHIGIMPLYDDDFSRGKCGFKAIQYMSLGIPAVVSPVGVNTLIVDEGINGFVCSVAGQWEERLKELIKNKKLRTEFGLRGKEKIERSYSVNATKQLFSDLFRD